MSKSRQHNKSFWASLIEFISEPIEQNASDLRSSFAEQGLDYDDLEKRGLQLVHSMERELRFAKAREQRDMVLKLIGDFKADLYKGRRDELVASFRDIFSPGQAAVAFFHKLESLDDEELREMLNEAEILEILEQQVRGSKEQG